MSASLRLRSAALLLAALPVLAACGDDTASAGSDPAPSSTPTSLAPSAPEPSPTKDGPSGTQTARVMPRCGVAWRVGATLPDPYRGCQGPAGMVGAKAQRCEMGQKLYTFAGRFYAVAGGPVNRTAEPLASDARYQAALKACTA